jgi:hypothetical protein
MLGNSDLFNRTFVIQVSNKGLKTVVHDTKECRVNSKIERVLRKWPPELDVSGLIKNLNLFGDNLKAA